MPIGNPVTLTSNIASKTISATATASQTLFNVTGGYRINSLGVFKNGSRLQDGVDYIARDGLTVTLLSAASGGDKLQFVVFDTFRVAEAIRPAVDEQTIRGNLNVVGILSATNLEGPLSFNITSGIQTFHDVRVGGALTVAGTLTYEDTTNTNTTGIATFSGGMNISGVGATATTLNVTGVSTFGDKVSIGDSIFHTGDINTSIRFPAADTFTVETGGSERFRVTSAGRVGINETDPDQKLHILDTAAGARHPILLQNRTNDDSSVGIQFIASGSDLSDGQFATIEAQSDTAGNTKHDLLFKTVTNGGTPTERLRITSGGNIGINSVDPTSYANSQATLLIEDTISPALCISDTGQARDWFIIGQGDGLAINYADGGGSGSASNVTGAMFLRNNGNIGINESTPQQQLHVHDDTAYHGIFVNGNGAPRINFARDTTTTAEWSVGIDGTNGNRFAIAQAGNTAKLIIDAGGNANITGITTANQLFEGSTRVASTGKAIAMAMLFG